VLIEPSASEPAPGSVRPGADGFAAAQARQVLLFLLVLAVAQDVVQAQVLVRHPGQGQGVVPAAEGLQHQAAGHQVEGGAAIDLGRGDTEVAGAADQGKYLIGPPLLVVHALAPADTAPSGRSGRPGRGCSVVVGQAGKTWAMLRCSVREELWSAMIFLPGSLLPKSVP